MSTKTHLLAAASMAAFFIASCAADNEPGNSAKRDEGVASDSVSYLGYESQTDNKPAAVTESDDFLRNEVSQQELESMAKADSIGKVLPTSSAALNRLDSTHMFIRTADVRCRVNEVADATYDVEDVVRDLGGYVSDTKLASTQTWQQSTQISDDSIKQVMHYQVSNTITIRVPARNLDSLLRALVPLVQYMDYRNVNVNDITLEQLAQQLEQKRLAVYNSMIKDKVIDETNKPDKIMNAADAILAKQAQADNAFLESLRLKDQVAYATLNLQLYQPETSEIAVLFREKPMEPYDPGIGERIGNAAYAGWKGFSYLLAGIVLLWPLWVIGAGVFIFVRWQIRKRAKST